jgi:POTRA domain-containing FtsQ-type protein
VSTEVLDERARHVALVRAQASLIVDSSRPVRRLMVTPGTRLHASPRKRRHSRRGHAPTPPVARRRTSWRRRIIAIAALTVQGALLALVLTLPAFQVRQVTVVGAHLVTTSAVVAAAEVPEESIFTINGAVIQSRVLALPWVESAVVTTQLPATVSIDIVERSPVLRVRRDGADTLIAANGATLPGIDATPAASSGIPVLIDDRAGSPQPLNPQLVQMLSTIAQRFPAVFGCSVAAYLWGADDVVSIWTSTGWRAVLGPLDTEDALQLLPKQIETLAALKAQLNFAHPSFGYLDVESPGNPVSGGSPGLPAEVRAALLPIIPATQPPPAASSVPPPTPQPTPTPSPSPATSPTPGTVSVSPNPSPSPSPKSSPSPSPSPSP